MESVGINSHLDTINSEASIEFNVVDSMYIHSAKISWCNEVDLEFVVSILSLKDGVWNILKTTVVSELPVDNQIIISSDAINEESRVFVKVTKGSADFIINSTKVELE